jgi:hypothetical protein
MHTYGVVIGIEGGLALVAIEGAGASGSAGVFKINPANLIHKEFRSF